MALYFLVDIKALAISLVYIMIDLLVFIVYFPSLNYFGFPIWSLYLM